MSSALPQWIHTRENREAINIYCERRQYGPTIHRNQGPNKRTTISDFITHIWPRCCRYVPNRRHTETIVVPLHPDNWRGSSQMPHIPICEPKWKAVGLNDYRAKRWNGRGGHNSEMKHRWAQRGAPVNRYYGLGCDCTRSQFTVVSSRAYYEGFHYAERYPRNLRA